MSTLAASATRRGQQERRPCVFCGRLVPLTREHLWSKQLSEILPDIGPGEHIFGLTGDVDSWRVQHRPPFSRAVKIVCADCNNGWMSRLEKKARPFLEPTIRGERRVTMQPDDQQVIAMWIAKTAMTMQSSHPTRYPDAIPRSHYTELFEERRPPLLSRIWIGAASHDDRPLEIPKPLMGRVRITPLKRFHPDGIPAWEPAVKAYSVAMSMGNLAMVMFGHEYRHARRHRLLWPDQFNEALVQVWPTSDVPVEWPGKYALGYPAFNALTQVFADYV
jgi:hypothetical protein